MASCLCVYVLPLLLASNCSLITSRVEVNILRSINPHFAKVKVSPEPSIYIVMYTHVFHVPYSRSYQLDVHLALHCTVVVHLVSHSCVNSDTRACFPNHKNF